MSNTSPPDNARPLDEKPFQFSLRAMLIGVAVFAILLGILVPLIRYAHKEALRAQCSNNLKQIALALHNYHDTYKCLPFAHVCGPDGKPWHSWRVALLPYLEAMPYYRRYRFDEPWDGPNNRKLHPVEIDLYRCPAEEAGAAATMTNYVAVVGPGTGWPVPGQTEFRDFTDGLSNSILVVEIVDSGIHWMEPRDLKLEDLQLLVNPNSGKGISSHHLGGALVSLGDGRIRFLPNDLAADTLRKMILINDGEEIPWDEISPDR
jgi:hypothetical protein